VASGFLPDSPSSSGIIYGAIFAGALWFWYALGSYVDKVRGLLDGAAPSRIAAIYLRVLISASFPVCALIVIIEATAGIRCWNDNCQYWAVPVRPGIVLFWSTVGVFFGIRGFLKRRTTRRLAAAQLSQLAPPEVHEPPH
jgi:hypothetical protein